MNRHKNSIRAMQEEISHLYDLVVNELYQAEDKGEIARLRIIEERLERQSKDIRVALYGVQTIANPCILRNDKHCWECSGHYKRAGLGGEVARDYPGAKKCRLYVSKPDRIFYNDEENN